MFRSAACILSTALALTAAPRAGADTPADLGASPEATNLFAPAAPDALDTDDLAVARARAAHFDAADLASITPASGRALALPLFDDIAYIAEPVSIRRHDENAFIWKGRLRDAPGANVLLAVRGGAAYGEVRDIARGRVFEIRAQANGLHAIVELDLAAFPPCDVGPEHAVVDPNPAFNPDELIATARGSGEVTLDVLVVYTPAAAASGSIESLIDAAVERANEALEDSFTSTKLRLVHTALVDYQESGSTSTDLSRLRDTDDPYMPEVHTLRQQYGADLVSLIVDFGGCGIGYVMTTPSLGFEDAAFTVVRDSCAVGNRTFAHEIGHNLGCAHDRDNANVAGSFDFSWGYRTTDEALRTVMSYSPGARLGYFSNPDISVNNPPEPFGVPVGQIGESHNALGIASVRNIAAEWRDAVLPASCPADLNADGLVGATDLAILVGSWGTDGSANVDGEGLVGAFDLAELLTNWGPCPD